MDDYTFLINKYGLFGNSPERWTCFLSICNKILIRCGEPTPSQDRWEWFVGEMCALMTVIQEPSGSMNEEERLAYGDQIIGAAMEEWESLSPAKKTAEALLDSMKKRAWLSA